MKVHLQLIICIGSLIFVIYHPLLAQKVNVPQINSEIILDGLINEEAWQDANSMNDFKQFQPNLSMKSTEQAETYILYNKNSIYVGIKIKYNDPSKVYARVLERDVSLDRDDYAEVHLDTYNDRTNSLVFKTNPLGARFDYESNRNGEEFNPSWNTFWNASSAITDEGWSTEFQIPFSSLRFKSAEEIIMRFKVVIYFKEKNEIVLFPLNETERQPVIFQYKNAIEIAFKNIPDNKPLYIAPYLKGGFISSNSLNEEENKYQTSNQYFENKNFSNNNNLDKLLSNVGLDVKYKIDQSKTLDITLNTDFAEVEADDRIVNVSRFAVFLPEKRLFFLENADLFNSNMFDHRLFHSRRIGFHDGNPIPIIGGLRFIGSSQKWQYGFLSMQTHNVDEENIPSYNMSTARVKKFIGSKGSYLGFMGSSKIENNYNDYNYLFAVDGNLRLTDNIRTRLAFANTFDHETGRWKPMYGLSINTFKSNGFGIQYRFREYTENFNPELGFVSQPNTKRLTTNHGWRKTYKNHNVLQYLSIGHYFRKNWVSSTGKDDFFQTNLYLFINLKKGFRFVMFAPMIQEDNLYNEWEIAENITIPEGKYKMIKFNPSFSTGNAYQYILRADFLYGEYYGGKQLTLTGNYIYDFNKNFQLEVGLSYNKLNLPTSFVAEGSNILNVNRYYSRIKISFSSKAFLNSYMQYQSQSKKVGWNLRFRYNFKEGTDLYFVYNQNINTDVNEFDPVKPIIESQVATIKFTKTFIK